MRDDGKLRSYAFVGLGAALCFLPYLRVLSPSADEGTLLVGADRVLRGELPGRDFFEVMGPGTFFWLAGFFKLLGATWLAARVELLLVNVATALLLFYASRRICKRWALVPVVLFAAVGFPTTISISHHLDSNLFALLSFGAFLRWQDRKAPVMLALAGAGAGCATCILQPKGVLLLLALAICVWLPTAGTSSRLRSIGILLAGYAAVGISLAGVYLWNGALWDLIYANVVWPATHYGGVNRISYAWGILDYYWQAWHGGLSGVLPGAFAVVIAGFLLLPLLAVAALPVILLALAVRAKPAALDFAVLPYWLAGIALFLSEFHRKDIFHLALGCPILLIAAVYLVEKRPDRFARGALAMLATAGCCVIACNALTGLSASTRIETSRGVAYGFRPDPVLAFLHEHQRASESVFVYPYAPIYYFLNGSSNPTRFSILMYGMNTNAEFEDVVTSLERKHVTWVVWHKDFYKRAVRKWFPAYQPPDHLLVEPYIERNYEPAGSTANGFVFLKRKMGANMQASR